jgi:aldose 1-epimerase
MLELRNSRIHAIFSPMGARLQSLIVDGVDVVVGNALEFDLNTGDQSAGAVCGRFAGRIARAQFPLDGKIIKLVPNRGDYQLHGGPVNFCNSMWNADADDHSIWFSHKVPDGDQGYPGAVEATAIYKLNGNALSLKLEATTTKPTVINLTNHAYWNLAGTGSALDHEMQINANSYLPLNDDLLPVGEIRKVEGSRWDFRKLRHVAEAYDNCFCLDGPRGDMKQALILRDPASGRRMEVWTTECAIQMYTAIHWNGTVPSKSGALQQHQAIAIEPQNYPDAPNHDNFPSAVLRPGETYRNEMEWRFPRS